MTKVAIIGTGTVGQTLAARLSDVGYEVKMGTRNVNAKLSLTNDSTASAALKAWLEKNNAIALVTFAEAAEWGEIILNATKGAESIAALMLCGADNLKAKTLIDVANPLDFSKGMPPCIVPELSNTNSLGEEIQRTFPNTKVVKTLNTMWCGLMANPVKLNGGEHTNFICGNDADAKKEVKTLLNAMGWKNENVLDLGDITSARGTEAVLPIWLRVWTATQNGAFNFKVVS